MAFPRFDGRAWAATFRRAPIGVLAISAMLFFVGAGLITGAVFFLLARPPGNWIALLLMLTAGPLCIYVALSLVLLRRRAWLVTVSLLGLLMASSAARAVTAGELPLSPLFELLVEGASLAYLARPRVRRAFTPPA